MTPAPQAAVIHGGKALRFTRAALQRHIQYIIDNVRDTDGEGWMETLDGWNENDIALLKGIIADIDKALDP